MKRKVLFLDQDYEYGGAQKVMLDLLEGLGKDKFDIYVVTCNKGKLYENIKGKNFNVSVLSLPEEAINIKREKFSFISLFGTAFKSLFFSFKLTGFVIKNNIEIIYTNTMEMHLLGGISGFFSLKKTVWRLHDIISPEANYSPFAVFLISKFADLFSFRVLCVSNAVKESLLKHMRNTAKVKVIYNGIRICCLNPSLRKSLNLNSGKLIIGWVGRITRVKAPDVFIKAAGLFKGKTGADCLFAVVGDASEEEKDYLKELKILVEELKLGGNLKFLGYSPKPLESVKDFDILVHTSVWPDPLPTVILEGMMCGAAVIASDVGGVREILRQGASRRRV